MKKTLKSQRKDLNDCRAEITTLKMHIEGALSGKIILSADYAFVQSPRQSDNGDTKLVSSEVEMLKSKTSADANLFESINRGEGNEEVDEVEESQLNDTASPGVGSLADLTTVDTVMMGKQDSDDTTSMSEKVPQDLLSSPGESGLAGSENIFKDYAKPSLEIDSLIMKSDNLNAELKAEKMVSSYCWNISL